MCLCVCVLKMYPAMVSGDHEGKCVCVLKMYPAVITGECVCACVEYVSSYGIW